MQWNHFDRVMKFNKKIFRIIKYMSVRNKLNKRIYLLLYISYCEIFELQIYLLQIYHICI